jgi:folate-dependent phosphoribosylglycinamide formyltransferase PurN
MKVAIFSHQTCPIAVSTLQHFKEQGLEISLVVIETAIRKKFSATELQLQTAHAAFNNSRAKPQMTEQNGRHSITQTLWLSIPSGWRESAKRLLPKSLFSNKSPVVREAKRLNVPVEYVEKHSSPETRAVLEKHAINFVLLTSSNWLIKEPLLSMADTRVINAHCARLPAHRSLDSLPWSIVDNDKIGLTTHFVDAGIDTGPILVFLEVQPEPGDNLTSLRARVNEKMPEAFVQSILGLRDKTIVPRPQKPEDGVHHAPMTVDQLLNAEQLLQERIRQQHGGAAS